MENKKTIKAWHKGLTNKRREALTGYMFVAPSMVIFTLFIFFPLLCALILGFFDFDIFFDYKFIGLSNFKEMLNDRLFWSGLKVTLKYTALEVPIQLFFSLITALYVSTNTFFRKVMRSVYFLPVVCSMTAIGIVFIYVFNPILSPFLYIYYALTGQSAPSLLTNAHTALYAIIGVSVWKNFGYTMVIMVAGLQAIPTIHYEAARLDGANKWQQFWYITVPQALPSLNFCLLITLISALQAFDQMFVMTEGGPVYTTQSLVMYIYSKGFGKYPYRIGYATAMAEVLFVIILIVSFIVRKVLMSREEELA